MKIKLKSDSSLYDYKLPARVINKYRLINNDPNVDEQFSTNIEQFALSSTKSEYNYNRLEAAYLKTFLEAAYHSGDLANTPFYKGSSPISFKALDISDTKELY
jgi:hypothetical protein